MREFSNYWATARSTDREVTLRVALVGVPVDPSVTPVTLGCTKTGGKPHLPRKMEWPRRYAFLGQYNLKELEDSGSLFASLLLGAPECGGGGVHGERGMLYFFGGFEEIEGKGKVVYLPPEEMVDMEIRELNPLQERKTKNEKEKEEKEKEEEEDEEDEDDENYVLQHPAEQRLRFEDHIVANDGWLCHHPDIGQDLDEELRNTPFLKHCAQTLAFGVPVDHGAMLGGCDLPDDTYLLFQLDDASITGNGYLWIEITAENLAAKAWDQAQYIDYAD